MIKLCYDIGLSEFHFFYFLTEKLSTCKVRINFSFATFETSILGKTLATYKMQLLYFSQQEIASSFQNSELLKPIFCYFFLQ